MPAFSVLDLSPVPDGFTAADALKNSGELARHAEELGYKRFWMAEHHNMPGIASAATAVALAYVAGLTRTIRVGAGGVMLPNHAPLVIAEQFGTLATLYPDRIDLGLGRAPGTDMMTTRALRRSLESSDSFPQDVLELMVYFEPAEDGQKLRAIPGEGTRVPVFILGSSLYGAQLAAHLGLPYAFASHFAPAALDQAVEVYRETYRPSERHPHPYFVLAANVFAADTDAEGAYLKSSMEQAFVKLRTGQPGKLPRPVEGYLENLDPAGRSMLDQALAVSAVGSPEKVRRELQALVEHYQPDEMILTGQIHDHAARLKSFAIAAEAMRRVNEARQAA
ncbi:LLM class flavin-dependent oxidoreductase [Jiella endophytica]|uniref:Luciferase-like monooxygenase n=1 Tax=Jiella endophytica TaxID=2558362 RepID=A0A4Y8RU62_9HYPH|nr:LLM class flavin-dependent oxidoreductase [Jiella endophytica]TFF20663.1 LLM class flavin-dependent oxidoreductase [Jiella endophytica]TFF26964.1 LLM class flavin-dependent oxidoreductase [Jiella endophytica]